ncbi:hypothetical protein Scep_018527 [Stephania cephalantha]|uniref:MAGE domain-containing protein n=1 Tax=Stephania cephalantha TaxID=152367 RepID=A0AAP0NL89_9MAGN
MASYNEDFSKIDISKEEKDKLVAEVVRYMLFKTHQSAGCPVKREELAQLVTKNYRQWNLPSLVIKEAGEKLSSIFGYELKELQRSRPSSTSQNRSSQQNFVEAKSYIIVSQLPTDVYKKHIEDANSSHMTGFTFAVISIVLLAGGKVPEENLWHHLKRLGLHESEERHPVLGNLKQALETLVQQRYLQKDKLSGPEGNTLFYELAERSLDQSVTERVKEYISKMVNKDITSVELADD